MSAFVRSLLMLAVALPWAARAEVRLGNEVLAARHFNALQGKRVGLFTNPSGVNRHLESTIEVLRAAAPLTAINFYAFEALKQVAGRDLFAETVKAGRGFGMFDKVNGTDATRKALQAGTSAAEIVASWKAGDEGVRKARRKYLLYYRARAWRGSSAALRSCRQDALPAFATCELTLAGEGT